jgi:uncharacterized protein
LKLLIFSDIHNDWKTLEGLLGVQADYYIAAGDQVTWAKGLDRCGEILAQRGDKVYVLPGNHESAEWSPACARASDCTTFTSSTSRSADGTSPAWAIPAPRPSTRRANIASRRSPSASAKFAELDPLVLVCHAPPYGTALDQIRPGLHAGSRAVREFIEKYRRRTSSAATSTRPKASPSEMGARVRATSARPGIC